MQQFLKKVIKTTSVMMCLGAMVTMVPTVTQAHGGVVINVDANPSSAHQKAPVVVVNKSAVPKGVAEKGFPGPWYPKYEQEPEYPDPQTQEIGKKWKEVRGITMMCPGFGMDGIRVVEGIATVSNNASDKVEAVSVRLKVTGKDGGSWNKMPEWKFAFPPQKTGEHTIVVKHAFNCKGQEFPDHKVALEMSANRDKTYTVRYTQISVTSYEGGYVGPEATSQKSGAKGGGCLDYISRIKEMISQAESQLKQCSERGSLACAYVELSLLRGQYAAQGATSQCGSRTRDNK